MSQIRTQYCAVPRIARRSDPELNMYDRTFVEEALYPTNWIGCKNKNKFAGKNGVAKVDAPGVDDFGIPESNAVRSSHVIEYSAHETGINSIQVPRTSRKFQGSVPTIDDINRLKASGQGLTKHTRYY